MAMGFVAKLCRPAVVHVSVIVLMVIYALLGGIIFAAIEPEVSVTTKRVKAIEGCIKEALNTSDGNVPTVVEVCVSPHLPTIEWTVWNSILYAFTIITTVGFGAYEPSTEGGKIFYLFFALVGIPLGMIAIANVGAFIKEYAIQFTKWHRRKRGKIKEGESSPDELSGPLILLFFLIYTCLGALLLLCINGWQGTFVNTLFYTFTPLTGGDFTGMASGRIMVVPVKVIYASLGLAITTIAIDAGSDTLKKVHHFGRKLKNAANAMIWFGAKRLSVGNLVHAVGRKCGVDDEEIDKWNLDELVETAVAESENKKKDKDPEKVESVAYHQPVENNLTENEIEKVNDVEANIELLRENSHEASGTVVAEPQNTLAHGYCQNVDLAANNNTDETCEIIVPQHQNALAVGQFINVNLSLARSEETESCGNLRCAIPVQYANLRVDQPTEVDCGKEVILEIPAAALCSEVTKLENDFCQIQEQLKMVLPKSFEAKHGSAVVEVENPKPGQPRLQHDPKKRLNVFKEEWDKLPTYARGTKDKRSRKGDSK